jgi:hypothetical protein
MTVPVHRPRERKLVPGVPARILLLCTGVRVFILWAVEQPTGRQRAFNEKHSMMMKRDWDDYIDVTSMTPSDCLKFLRRDMVCFIRYGKVRKTQR